MRLKEREAEALWKNGFRRTENFFVEEKIWESGELFREKRIKWTENFLWKKRFRRTENF